MSHDAACVYTAKEAGRLNADWSLYIKAFIHHISTFFFAWIEDSVASCFG